MLFLWRYFELCTGLWPGDDRLFRDQYSLRDPLGGAQFVFIKPEFFLSLWPTLGIALGITVAVELVLFLLGFGTEFTDYIVIAIFSLYLGFDWQRANRVTPSIRNAILSATQIYLDIVNIFIRLLRILARSRKN